jgi:phospholipase C
LPAGKPALSMLLALAAIAAVPIASRAQDAAKPATPVTPIQHVIVIFGENRSFDHVFGTYLPKNGQTVWNLFSKGIVNADGTPGPNYEKSYQYSATDSTLYSIHPGGKQLYANVPPPGTTYVQTTGCDPEYPPSNYCYGQPFATVAVAEQAEPDLPLSYYQFLTTGASGLAEYAVDTRVANYNSLGSGVYQLTGPTLSYDDYTGSPVHRFYQMWQQTDCDEKAASSTNPSGCQSDLFPWVEVTIGAGSNGQSQAQYVASNYCGTFNEICTGEGGDSAQFYNMQTGDVPYLKSLADKYTLLDNMHQSIMGGTGPNHIALGYADAIWYSDGNGNAATPANNQIENPNPQPGTNNWYAQDGYSGGSYTDCADMAQPGVAPIVNYLKSLPKPIKPNCQTGHFYLLNNYNPGYNGDGTLNTFSQYTVPPTSQPHIGDVLATAGLSYTFFGEGWDLYLTDLAGQNPFDEYCNICNVFQYATDVMTNPTERAAHIQDTSSFFADIATNSVPAVSIIQPSGFVDGHPASSKIDLWEGFVENIVSQVQLNQELWKSTAIFLIFDEGGGYYDSGYIQPVDWFGDGTRMPALIVSPYAAGGNVYHGYADHVSIDKFIERNWNLPTISSLEGSTRTRDNLPNPTTATNNPYVPTNSPAIDDLFGAFHFPKQ